MGILMYSILGATVGVKLLLWMYCSVRGLRLCSLVGPAPVLALAYICWLILYSSSLFMMTAHHVCVLLQLAAAAAPPRFFPVLVSLDLIAGIEM